jgi:hypothetical protein
MVMLTAVGDDSAALTEPLVVPIQLITTADANGDLLVDGADYAVWADHYLQQTTEGAAAGDFSLDGVVDAADYTIWADNYGRVLTQSESAALASLAPTLAGLPAPTAASAELPAASADEAAATDSLARDFAFHGGSPLRREEFLAILETLRERWGSATQSSDHDSPSPTELGSAAGNLLRKLRNQR